MSKVNEDSNGLKVGFFNFEIVDGAVLVLKCKRLGTESYKSTKVKIFLDDSSCLKKCKEVLLRLSSLSADSLKNSVLADKYKTSGTSAENTDLTVDDMEALTNDIDILSTNGVSAFNSVFGDGALESVVDARYDSNFNPILTFTIDVLRAIYQAIIVFTGTRFKK